MIRNLLFLAFIPAFALLYVAANSQNQALGLCGIALTIVDAVVVLLMRK